MNLRKIRTLLLALGVFTVFGCGELDEGGSSSAKIEVLSKRAFFINGTTKSCTARAEGTDEDDVSAFYYRVLGVRLPPAPAGKRYRIFQISIKLRSTILAAGPNCTIASDELLNLVSGTPVDGSGNTPSNAALVLDSWRRNTIGSSVPGEDEFVGAGVAADKQYVTFDCPITCGGVSIPTSAQDSSFTADAELEVLGSVYPVSDPLQELPFRTTTNFTVEYYR